MSSPPRSLRAVWGALTQDLAQSWQGQSEDARASKQLALDAPDKPLLLMGPGADALDEKKAKFINMHGHRLRLCELPESYPVTPPARSNNRGAQPSLVAVQTNRC